MLECLCAPLPMWRTLRLPGLPALLTCRPSIRERVASRVVDEANSLTHDRRAPGLPYCFSREVLARRYHRISPEPTPCHCALARLAMTGLAIIDAIRLRHGRRSSFVQAWGALLSTDRSHADGTLAYPRCACICRQISRSMFRAAYFVHDGSLLPIWLHCSLPDETKRGRGHCRCHVATSPRTGL